jgi:hypothetical protein
MCCICCMPTAPFFVFVEDSLSRQHTKTLRFDAHKFHGGSFFFAFLVVALTSRGCGLCAAMSNPVSAQHTPPYLCLHLLHVQTRRARRHRATAPTMWHVLQSAAARMRTAWAASIVTLSPTSPQWTGFVTNGTLMSPLLPFLVSLERGPGAQHSSSRVSASPLQEGCSSECI